MCVKCLFFKEMQGKQNRLKYVMLHYLPMFYPTFLEIWNAIGRVSIILSCLIVLTAFIEADMWHFTEPDTLGFSVFAAIVFVSSIVLPQFPMLFRTVRVLRISKISKFFLAVFPSLLLLIVSLPALAQKPMARTMLLSLGVISIPYLFYWILHHSTYPQQCCTTSCFSQSSFTFCKERQSFNNEDSHLGVEILMAVLFSMSCRWVSISINLFYEAYEPTVLLFTTVFIYATWRFLSNDFCKETRSQDATTLVITESQVDAKPPDSASQNNIIEKNISTGIVNEIFEMEDVKKSEPNLNNSAIPNDSIVQQQNEAPGLKEATLTPFRVFILWATGILSGLEIGSITSTFLWIFSSPNILCLWSGQDPKIYGSQLLVLFLVSLVIIIIDPRTFLKAFETTKVGWLARVIKIAAFLILCGFLYLAMIFFCWRQYENKKYAGACILTFFLPIVLLILADNFNIILRITSLPLNGCNCTCFLPGVIGLIATLTFCSLHVLSIFFVIPYTTRALLGQIKIIGSTKVVLVSLALLLHLIFTSIQYLPISKQKSSSLNGLFSQKLNRKKIIYICVTSIFVVTSLGIGPTYLIRQCSGVQDIGNINVDPGSYQCGDKITVLSWNILLLHDYWGKDSSSCIAQVVKATAPDIVGFQESDPSPLYWGGKDSLGYFRTFLKGEYIALNPLSSLDATFGVSLLTRLGVLNHTAKLLPTDTNVNVPNYAVIQATLEVSSKIKHTNINNTKNTIHVFNLHSVYKGWTDPPLVNLSRIQIEFVMDQIKLLPEHAPLIVMGDFNLRPDESELDPFYDQQLGLKSVFHPKRNEFGISTLLGNSTGSVDHIFYRGLELVSSEVIVDVDFISDHRPIFAEFLCIK